MLIPTSLLMLVLVQTSQFVDAFSPHKSLLYATERLHKFAKRKGSRLARDLHVVFQAIIVESDSSHPVVCVKPSDPFAALQGSSTSPASASITTTRSHGATGTNTHAPEPSGTSAYKLVESYVSYPDYEELVKLIYFLYSRGTISLMDGPFLNFQTRQTVSVDSCSIVSGS